MLYSTFFVQETQYALPVLSILEIGRSFKINKVHGSQEQVEGLVNLRGKVIPILNLGVCLGLGDVKPSDDSRMYIFKSMDELNQDALELKIRTSEDNVGLHVDKMGDVIEIDSQDVSPVPANSTHPYYRNVIKRENEFIIILNLEKILNLSEEEVAS